MQVRAMATGILLAAALSAPGAVLRARSGNVLAAESSTRSVEVAGADENSFAKIENPAYAVLTIRMDSGRTLSLYDYSLKIGSNSYPAAALRTPGGRFSLYPTSINDPQNLPCQILFIVDKTALGSTGEFAATLHAEFPPENLSELKLKFKNRGDAELRPGNKIKDSGEF